MKTLTKKTVLEVMPHLYRKVKKGASSSTYSMKMFTSLLLDYALNKYNAGQIQLVEPNVADVTEGKEDVV